MRNLANIAMGILAWIVLAAMAYAIAGVLAQPMVYGSEKPILKQELLKPGYMPDTSRGSQIAPKRFSRSEGYLYDPNTGTTRYVELHSYQYGKETYYTGRVSHSAVQIESQSIEKIDEK